MLCLSVSAEVIATTVVTIEVHDGPMSLGLEEVVFGDIMQHLPHLLQKGGALDVTVVMKEGEDTVISMRAEGA